MGHSIGLLERRWCHLLAARPIASKPLRGREQHQRKTVGRGVVSLVGRVFRSLRGSVCESLAWLHVQPIPPRTGAFDDTASATHDRGYAGAELGAAHPGDVFFACLPVRPPLSQIAGTAGSG